MTLLSAGPWSACSQSAVSDPRERRRPFLPQGLPGHRTRVGQLWKPPHNQAIPVPSHSWLLGNRGRIQTPALELRIVCNCNLHTHTPSLSPTMSHPSPARRRAHGRPAASTCGPGSWAPAACGRGAEECRFPRASSHSPGPPHRKQVMRQSSVRLTQRQQYNGPIPAPHPPRGQWGRKTSPRAATRPSLVQR